MRASLCRKDLIDVCFWLARFSTRPKYVDKVLFGCLPSGRCCCHGFLETIQYQHSAHPYDHYDVIRKLHQLVVAEDGESHFFDNLESSVAHVHD